MLDDLPRVFQEISLGFDQKRENRECGMLKIKAVDGSHVSHVYPIS